MNGPDLDEGLRAYATPRQWEIYCAVQQHGSQHAAAGVLGIRQHTISQSLATLRKNAALRGYAPANDMMHPAPPGFQVKGTSTLYDLQTGEARIQWVKTKQDGSDEALQAIIDGLKDEVPRCEATTEPTTEFTDVLVGYPIGDHHIGMLAHSEEADTDYDIGHAEALLRQAMARLSHAVPASQEGLIAVLGDFLHFDGWSAVTPTNGHLLDADGRFYRVVRAALRILRYAVSCALMRHKRVTLSITIGNHDLASAVWLMEALAMFYEDEPRVVVDTSPSHFKYHRFGKNLIGIHHGHGRAAKPADLPGIMASDRAADWGETAHRTWWTGHIHTKTGFETPGCTVESFRILPPADAYAANMGYRSKRTMQAIVFDREYGERERHTITPEMMRQT